MVLGVNEDKILSRKLEVMRWVLRCFPKDIKLATVPWFNTFSEAVFTHHTVFTYDDNICKTEHGHQTNGHCISLFYLFIFFFLGGGVFFVHFNGLSFGLFILAICYY